MFFWKPTGNCVMNSQSWLCGNLLKSTLRDHTNWPSSLEKMVIEPGLTQLSPFDLKEAVDVDVDREDVSDLSFESLAVMSARIFSNSSSVICLKARA